MDTQGSFSFQNILVLANSVFKSSSALCKNHLILFLSSNVSIEPISINVLSEIIHRLSFSCFSLKGSIGFYEKLVDFTGGKYFSGQSIDDANDFSKLVMAKSPSSEIHDNSILELFKIAFPCVKHDSVCFCHQNINRILYACPQCESLTCTLPTTCPGCRINLISQSILAETYRRKNLLETIAVSTLESCKICNLILCKNICKFCNSYLCDACIMFLHNNYCECIFCI